MYLEVRDIGRKAVMSPYMKYWFRKTLGIACNYPLLFELSKLSREAL